MNRLIVWMLKKNEPWYHDVKVFLKEGIHPSYTSTMIGGRYMFGLPILSQWWYVIQEICGNILLRCVDAKANIIMFEYREGACGSYMSRQTLAHKILRMCYCWSTMENDYFKQVRKCYLCQIDANNEPSVTLYNMSNHWPFFIWSLYAIAIINLEALEGHRFILVTLIILPNGWAASFATLTKKWVLRFLKHNIICRYCLLFQ